MTEDQVKIFVLGHSDRCFQTVPECSYLQKVNLNHLQLPIPNTNDLAENRFFLLDESYFDDCPEYVGVLTWQYDRKYNWLLPLSEIHEMFCLLDPKKVYAAAPTTVMVSEWVDYTINFHKTIRPYMDTLSDITGLLWSNKECFWANNFICHREVFLKFIRFARATILKMNAMHGSKMAYYVEDKSRIPAYLYERLTMLWFSNRHELSFKCIPKKDDWLKNVCWVSSAAENYSNIKQVHSQSLAEIGVQHHRVKHTHFYLSGEKSVGFRSDAYQISTEMKVRYMIASIEESIRDGDGYEFFIVTDCDVQFFPDRNFHWRRLLESVGQSDKICWFVKESADDVNTGVVIVKADKAKEFLEFYRRVLEKMQSTDPNSMIFMDQTIVNDCKSQIDYGLIPAVHCILGNNYTPAVAKTALFHHAVGTRYEQDKLDQMRHVRALMCSFKDTIFVYKNYKKDDKVLLSMKSLRHFIPYVDLFCLCLYDESESEYDSLVASMMEINAKPLFAKKAHADKGHSDADQGYHVIEYVNRIQSLFQTRERVVILDETNYFLTGETLRTLMDNPWDLCYGFTFANNLSHEFVPRLPKQTMSHKTIALNMSKFRHLFPLPEVPEDPNIILGYYLIETAREMKSRIIELRTRNHLYWEGDGTWTENIGEMRGNLMKAGII